MVMVHVGNDNAIQTFHPQLLQALVQNIHEGLAAPVLFPGVHQQASPASADQVAIRPIQRKGGRVPHLF